MPGPPDTSTSKTILDFFAGTPVEPVTAATIADDTGLSTQTVRDELDALVDQGVLQSKTVAGNRVWWSPLHDHDHDDEGVSKGDNPPAASAEANDTEAARQRLRQQHRQLAELVTRIDISDDLDEILNLITEEARELVGAHQSVTSRTITQNWEQAINAVSLSEKYEEYQDYDTEPDGSGIYSLVCERNEPMRMTQSELESHPAWNAFGDEADEHPPMQGWLAVPIVGPDGQNMGVIQLSDKYRGEFTEADQAILVQLANVAAAAIENARLYTELRESEERYRTLFDSMTEGYCVVEQVDGTSSDGSDFRYVEANPAFTIHTGLRDVIGDTIREASPNEPREWIDVLDTVVETGDVVEFETGTRDRDLQCQAFPIGDQPEGKVGVIVQDITERVERERRLKASNERLEQFAHAASHDLQEPLRMVSSYLQLLESRCADDLDGEAEEFLEFAVDGADRMRAMVDGLLAYSRVETRGNPLEPTDMNDVLADVRDDLQIKIDESNADLTVADLPRVEGDADQLRQVFQNLLENAIEYSDDQPPRIDVRAERNGSKWTIAVEDEGIGIDPAHSDTVFQVFERLHTSDEYLGTGIGLALCERIVERHGGEIWVESEPGEGSTFYLTLPAVDR